MTWGDWSDTYSNPIAVTVTPPNATLATTLYAPTVTTSGNQFVTPGPGALTTSLFAPTVTNSNPWWEWSATYSNTVSLTVTPPTATLTTTRYAPTVTTTGGIVLTPPKLAAITTMFPPAVSVGGAWGTWSSTFSNTVAAAMLVTPVTASLAVSTFAPTVTGGSFLPVAPVFQSNVFQPDVFQVEADANAMIIPPKASLVLTTYPAAVTGAPPGSFPDVTVPMLTLQWAYASQGSHPQAAYQVVLTDFTSGAVIWDTGIVEGAEETVSVPPNTLENGTFYEWTVTVWDDQGLSGSMDPAGFMTDFSIPATPTGFAGWPDTASSGVALTWGASGLPADEFVRWVLYRKDSSDAPFVQIGEVDDQATLAYTDYGCPLGVQVSYRLTQDNGWSESASASTAETLAPNTPRSWQLVVGGNDRLTLEFAQGTISAAPSEMEAPKETYQVIGRTVPITETGILGGSAGSLTVLLRADTLYLEGRVLEVQRSNEPCWLKDAYGNSTLVRLTALSREPGTVGRTDITVDWVQVD